MEITTIAELANSTDTDMAEQDAVLPDMYDAIKKMDLNQLRQLDNLIRFELPKTSEEMERVCSISAAPAILTAIYERAAALVVSMIKEGTDAWSICELLPVTFPRVWLVTALLLVLLEEIGKFKDERHVSDEVAGVLNAICATIRLTLGSASWDWMTSDAAVEEAEPG